MRIWIFSRVKPEFEFGSLSPLHRVALSRSHLLARASLIHPLVSHRPSALLSDPSVQVIPRAQVLPPHGEQLRVAGCDVRTDQGALRQQRADEAEDRERAGFVPSGCRKWVWIC